MILVPAGETERCAALSPALAAAVRALAALPADAADGDHPLAGGLVARVRTAETAPALGRPFVSRPGRWTLRRVLAGEERVLHAPAAGLEPLEGGGDDDGDGDGAREHDDPPYASSLLLHTGDLVALAPADAWKAGCMAGGRRRVRTATVEIPA